MLKKVLNATAALAIVAMSVITPYSARAAGPMDLFGGGGGFFSNGMFQSNPQVNFGGFINGTAQGVQNNSQTRN